MQVEAIRASLRREEITLPFLRAALQEFVRTGEERAIPIDATADTIIALYCNAILFIANAADPETAARDMDTVIFSMLSGLRDNPSGDL